VGVFLDWGSFPKSLRVLYNIFDTAEASNFTYGTLLGFAKAHQNPTSKKVHVTLCYRSCAKFLGFSLIFVQRLTLASSNLACSWGWPRLTIKTENQRKK